MSLAAFDVEELQLAPDPVTGFAPRWHCFRDSPRRLKEEGRLFCSSLGVHMLFNFFIVSYCASLLFRNLAFHRHKGLVYYADKVVPHSASVPLDSALLVGNGTAVSLASALAAPQDYRGFFNVSVVMEDAKANLTALNGESFVLDDLGYSLFPDLSSSAAALNANEYLATLIQGMTTAFLVVPYIISFQNRARPHLMAIWLRLLRALASVHLLRTLTYMATSIPGPANHCQSIRWTSKHGAQGSEEIGHAHVLTLVQIFLDTYNLTHNSNCGDLIFSGHTVNAMTNVMTLHFYVWRTMPPWLARVICAIAWLAFFVQIFLVLSSHNHYAVDTVVGLYTAPLNFMLWVYLFPDDPTPDDMEPGYFCGRRKAPEC